jgi:hypothetical protein
MNHWHFILGAYGLTLILLVVEVLSVRARRRSAARTAAASGAPPRAGSPNAPRTPH